MSGGASSVSRSRTAIPSLILVGAVTVAALAGLHCAAHRSVAGGGTRPTATAAKETSSNVLRDDYAGSAACVPCHGEMVARFQRSPMHRMTRLVEGPEPAEVRAPFDGRSLSLEGDVATLEGHEGRRYVRVRSSRFGDHLYRVTKVIGGHYREDFAGVEVTAIGDVPLPPVGSREELVLPVSYLIDSGTLRYKGYSVMVKERPGLRAGPVWKQTCILCHNTGPAFTSLLGALAGPRAAPYQGEIVDALLPPARRQTLEIVDGDGLREAARREIQRVGGGAPPTRLDLAARQAAAQDGQSSAVVAAREACVDALVATRARFDERHLVEIGIGCEACHGGAAAHVADPKVLPVFGPRAPFLAPSAASPAERINRVCARCHQVLFSGYEGTWEGGTRNPGRGGSPNAGGSHINSGEARDFLLGPCSRSMACSACHDPHAPEGHVARTRREGDGRGHNAVCVGCHAKYGDEGALKAHTHHDLGGAAGACIACHMPRKNMGLGGELTRYHRIGSPTDMAKVLLDRPLECALCHEDKSVEALVGTMERWWGKRYDREALVRLYGELESSVLLATLARGKAHEKAVALFTVGQARWKPARDAVRAELQNPYPLVAGYAAAALIKIDAP